MGTKEKWNHWEREGQAMDLSPCEGQEEQMEELRGGQQGMRAEDRVEEGLNARQDVTRRNCLRQE